MKSIKVGGFTLTLALSRARERGIRHVTSRYRSIASRTDRRRFVKVTQIKSYSVAESERLQPRWRRQVKRPL